LWSVRPRTAVVCLALTFAAFNYVLVSRIVPSLERLKPVVDIARVMRERSGEQGNLAFFDVSFPSLSHYVGRPVVQISAGENARSFFFNDRGAWVIMSEDGFAMLRQAIITLWPAAASAPAVALPMPLLPPVTMIRMVPVPAAWTDLSAY